MRSLAKIKPSQNEKISLSFTDVGKSCKTRKYFTWQMSFNAIREIKFSGKFSNLQYIPVKKFQSNQDRSCWVEPVLSREYSVLLNDPTQYLRWGLSPQLFDLKSSSPPQSHCAPLIFYLLFVQHCRSWSVGFWWSQLLRIHIVYKFDWKYMLKTGAAG